MRGRLAASCLILLLAAVPAIADATRAHRAAARVAVKPTSGVSTTRFTVSFRAPDRSGHSGVFQRSYRVVLSGTPGKRCVSSANASPRAGRAGARVKVAFDPAKHGRKWCQGTYRGRVLEITGPWCPPGKQVCPKFATTVRTLGKFRFRVRKSPKDVTAPVFAGLQGAFSCAGGPRSSAQVESFTLGWKPATDDTTPRAGIVYEVFMATTSDNENFAKPTWKSAAGATSFQTPGLPSNSAYYFVVRARDVAGNVDRNRVERLGHVLPCV